MEIIFIWLLLAVGVGLLANSRGRSGIGFFLLSAILSPLLGLIVVLVMSNKIEDERKERLRREEEEKKEQLRREEHERQVESIKAIASRSDAVASSNAAGPAARSVADELAKLAELRDKGVLTDSEFLAQKAALLSSK